ncbi:MAG: diguanylate cyclase [Candidatus Omnitrophica bacterium]|nr:diguanylate cyclase [Candidatus Omnitrophota bacterium]
MKKMLQSDMRERELMERMTTISEELEDLVRLSKHESVKREPAMVDDEVSALFRKSNRSGMALSKALLSIYRIMVVKNLVRGRFYASTYNTGKKLGLSVAVRSQREFVKVVRRFGFGSVRIVSFDVDNVVLRLRNTFTSQGVKHSKRPICYFEAGFFAGLLENVYRRKFDMKETACRAMKDPYCEFHAIQSAIGQKQTEAIHGYPLEVYSQESLKLLTSLAAHSIAAIENTMLFERTRKQVVTDSLTQIYNHRYFQTQLQTEFMRSLRHDQTLTVFMMDIDNFKNFNDRFGHPKGDEILKMVASAITDNIRQIDIAARYGGDEFAVILPQTDEKAAYIIAQRLQKKIADRKIMLDKRKVTMTISLGGVTVRPGALKKAKPSDIIDLADKALLTAKRKGKNNAILVTRS